MDYKKRIMKNVLHLIICMLCTALLYGCGKPISAEMTVPAIEVPSQATISDAEKRIVPSPYWFFNVADSYEEDVIENSRCALGFDEYPKLAVEAYCTLLTETYGLIKSDTGKLGLSLVEYPGTIYFLNPENGATCIKFYWLDAEGVSSILCVDFSEDCKQEKREMWDGDISQYQYNLEEWQVCEVCDGTSECSTCHGEGKIREADWDFWYYEDCPDCIEGKCHAGCIGGKVRIHE